MGLFYCTITTESYITLNKNIATLKIYSHSHSSFLLLEFPKWANKSFCIYILNVI